MAEESGARSESVGAHTIAFEPPDVCVFQMVGDISGDELVRVAQFLKEVPAKFHLIVDTGRLGSFTTSAKKAIREVPLAAAVAIFGASRQMQLVLSILNKVYMMVNLGTDIPLTFVPNEDEARKWIDYQRARKAAG